MSKCIRNSKNNDDNNDRRNVTNGDSINNETRNKKFSKQQK